jgi:hypothetical protein
MKYTITKSQYRRVLLKYLEEFVGDLIVIPKEDSSYRWSDVITEQKEEFAVLWEKGPVTKGCKKELDMNNSYMEDFESMIPLKRKKVFSEVMLEYFTSKTGVKCDCIEYYYLTGKKDDYGDDEYLLYNFNLRSKKR